MLKSMVAGEGFFISNFKPDYLLIQVSSRGQGERNVYYVWYLLF